MFVVLNTQWLRLIFRSLFVLQLFASPLFVQADLRSIVGATVHSEKDERLRWLWRAPVFGDFVVLYTVQCREIPNLKKGPKKAPQLGFEPQMYCYASEGSGLDFHGFSAIQCFGDKTWLKSYSCYGLLFGEIDFKNTIGRAFHGMGLPKQLCGKLKI